jgi:hypothetical protein
MARRWAAGYLAIQGLLAVAWWTGLAIFPHWRQPFLPDGVRIEVLLALALPDLPLFVGGSFAAGFGVALGARWAWPVLLVHSGAAAYAALFALGLTGLTGEAWLGAILMAPALVVPAFLAWLLRPGGPEATGSGEA